MSCSTCFSDQLKTQYLPQLDSLRAIACLCVLLAHLHAIAEFEFLPLIIGPAGVAIFFALSGFLITRGLLYHDSNLLSFYNKRAARILPPYFLVLVVLAFTWPGRQLTWISTFSFNLLYLTRQQEYFNINVGNEIIPPVGHFWSLCVEEHYYWIWPLLIVYLGKRFANLAAVVVIVLTPGVTDYIHHMLATRLFEVTADGYISRVTCTQLTAICIGSLYAHHIEWLSQTITGFIRRIDLVSTGLIVLGALIDWSSGYDITWQPTSLHLICSGLFGLSIRARWLARSSILLHLGKISYGLYLYHLPIYAWLGLLGHIGHQNSPQLAVGVMALGLTWLVSMISYHLMEQPIIRWNRQHNHIQRPTYYMGIVIAFLLVIMMGASVTHESLKYNSIARALLGITPEQAKLQRTYWKGGIHFSIYQKYGIEFIIDENGYRVSEPFPEKQEHLTRVLFVGDSYIWGACVAYDQILTAQLKLELKNATETGTSVEILNFGCSGDSAADIDLRISKVITKHKPDFIIYAITNNDWQPEKSLRTSDHSHNQLRLWYRESIKASFIKHMTSIQDQCQSNGIKFYAFVFSQYPNRQHNVQSSLLIQEYCQQAGVCVIPVDRYLSQYADRDFEAFPGVDGHPNPECHEIYARLIADYLVQNDLLKKQPALIPESE